MGVPRWKFGYPAELNDRGYPSRGETLPGRIFLAASATCTRWARHPARFGSSSQTTAVGRDQRTSPRRNIDGATPSFQKRRMRRVNIVFGHGFECVQKFPLMVIGKIRIATGFRTPDHATAPVTKSCRATLRRGRAGVLRVSARPESAAVPAAVAARGQVGNGCGGGAVTEAGSGTGACCRRGHRAGRRGHRAGRRAAGVGAGRGSAPCLTHRAATLPTPTQRPPTP